MNTLRSKRFLEALQEQTSLMQALQNTANREVNRVDLANDITDWYMRSISLSENQAADDMNTMLLSYWTVAVNNFWDTIPKIIQKDLFDSVNERLAGALFCLSSDRMEDFFFSPGAVTMRRQELAERVDRLRKASSMLQRMWFKWSRRTRRFVMCAHLSIAYG